MFFFWLFIILKIGDIALKFIPVFYGDCYNLFPDSTSLDDLEETESLSAKDEEANASVTEEIIDEEFEALEEKQESSQLEESKVQEERPSVQETRTAGDRYTSAPSSSLEFSPQPSVRQSMLLMRKEEMLQQARRWVTSFILDFLKVRFVWGPVYPMVWQFALSALLPCTSQCCSSILLDECPTSPVIGCQSTTLPVHVL